MTSKFLAGSAMDRARELLKPIKKPFEFPDEWARFFRVRAMGERPEEYDERLSESVWEEMNGKLVPCKVAHVSQHIMMHRFNKDFRQVHSARQLVWLDYFPADMQTLALIGRSKARFARTNIECCTMFAGELVDRVGRPKGKYAQGLWVHIWNVEAMEQAYKAILRQQQKQRDQSA